MAQKSYKPVILVVMDGFGVSSESRDNAVALAKKPTLDMFDAYFPMTTLQASGVAVGLPWGEAGNSEVGHLTIGAGRVIYHHMPRIVYAIQEGSFYENTALLGAVGHVKERNSNLHIVGLASSGSVHSYIDHMYALMRLVEQKGIERAFLHLISDGKDAVPKEGARFFDQLSERMTKEFPHTKIASIIGRNYAMDRDEQWERTKKAYLLFTEGVGSPIQGSVGDYLRGVYDQGITDEFVEPAFVAASDGTPLAMVRDGDAVIFSNFREDSMRQISHAFADVTFDHFPRPEKKDLFIVTMTRYEKDLLAEVAFPPIEVVAPLSKIVSDSGLKQLHIAETEKYAHVTYFFNGGRERPFPGEERILVPSATNARFDEAPEMRASEITSRVMAEFEKFDFILVNYANADMVGHSGNLDAAARAIEAVDQSLRELYEAVLPKGGVLVVTGDHGNAEAKRNPFTGERLTEHSLNPVPLYLIGEEWKLREPRDASTIATRKKEVGGILTDVAPTVLDLLGVRKPLDMTGTSLLGELTREHFHRR